ncbi:MAG: hypothetical protein V1736_05240 [Pseudomonadota bacterium]
MNGNVIHTEGYSNSDTKTLYEKECFIDSQLQCGGCSYYAIFNADWGLCCNPESRFHLETVFEHFGCEKNVPEGWGSHSFQDKPQHNVDDLTGLLSRCMEVFEKETVRKRHKSLLLEMRHYFRSHGMAYCLKGVPGVKRTKNYIAYGPETEKENWDQSAEERKLTKELLKLDDEQFQSVLARVRKERDLVDQLL